MSSEWQSLQNKGGCEEAAGGRLGAGEAVPFCLGENANQHKAQALPLPPTSSAARAASVTSLSPSFLTYLSRLGGLHALTRTKLSAQCLAHSKRHPSAC